MSSAAQKTLVLLRHAKAERGVGVDDHDRQLTDRGRRDAQAAGAWLRDQDIFCDLVICSTSIRTRQTWESAVRGGATTEFVEYRKGVYHGGLAQVLGTIREDGEDLTTVLVVGHAPTMPALAAALTDGEGDPQAHRAMAAGFPTSALAVLTYGGEWPDLDPGTATLRSFHVARG